MKKYSLPTSLLVAALLGAVASFAQTPAAALAATAPAQPQTPAEAAWTQLLERVDALFKARPKSQEPAEVALWGRRWTRELYTGVLDIFAQYPDDPFRWTALARSSNSLGWLVPGQREDTPESAAVFSAAERARVLAELNKLFLAGVEAPDAPAEIRLRLDQTKAHQLSYEIVAILKNSKRPKDELFAAQQAEVERLAAKYPDVEKTADNWAGWNVSQRQQAGATVEEIKGLWRHYASLPCPPLRKKAAAALEKMEKELDLASRPLELAFTAVDGRTVDLAKLRGKVVLVDFWATWCGPCVAELPNIKQVYAAYHDKGFEVVGIALENGKLTDKDTPEQREQKLAAAKKVLTDFTAKNDLPWPQYFDGKFWKTDYAVQYEIKGVPAMFLLDPDGRVVSTNARGAALERELKRLLKR